MKLLLVGCGHMGKALLSCFESNPMITDITVVDPTFTSTKHRHFKAVEDATDSYDVLILAVKPQVYSTLDIKVRVSHVISVMAGIGYKQLIETFPDSVVVRLMPNMAVAYEKGLSILYGATLEKQSFFHMILHNTGLLKWVDDESELDVLTLFNACGPGLLLGITEQFVQVLKLYGFSEDVAAALMKQVFIGTGTILEHDKRSLGDLINSVATKAGITEVCLHVLQPEIDPILKRTIKAGLERIQTVGK